ncbi:MAG: RNA repair transcriptional activator RtcR, partial [Nannocystaceae bacterium]
MRRRVIIGLLGTTLDAGSARRWERWRPTVDLARHDDMLVDRFELLHTPEWQGLAQTVRGDILQMSPETTANCQEVLFDDPWDFEQVFASLLDFSRAYTFNPEEEDYYVHITTGTHVAQICLFLLTEARYFPATLLQTSPPPPGHRGEPGTYRVIDLDLSKYDQIASRFGLAQAEGLSLLKAGIATRSQSFNHMITRIEQVAARSQAPVLLTGPTGAGKTHMARRIYDLKRQRRQLEGPFVEINCATLRGDTAMSALFGHVRGAFTGAGGARAGVLKSADGGLLFLDEIGELGLDEQAMLLRAIEDHRFLPVGSDREVTSDFQLIAGTNRDLRRCVHAGSFREDLLARINLWSFRLPGLRERAEDIEPNLDFELERQTAKFGTRLTINRSARQAFLRFATSPEGRWYANFRDLAAAVERMATLAPGGRINAAVVREEIDRLRLAWDETDLRADASGTHTSEDTALAQYLSPDAIAGLDRFDRVQLADVLQVCQQARSLSEAGRTLFSATRKLRKTTNDADRLRKYLAKYGLSWKSM